KVPKFDFIGNRYYAYAFSGLLILAGIGSIVVKGGLRYGIDFTGGAMVQLNFKPAVSAADLRKSIEKMNLGSIVVQDYGEKGQGGVLIRVEKTGADLKGLGERIVGTLKTDFQGNSIDLRQVEMVGPQVGRELRDKAFWAVCYAMIGILIYAGWRFELKFSVAAVVALIHDVLITVGFFSIINKEIDLTVIAALLTIAGYSINDTIVVFDRFRENLHSMRKEPYTNIFNVSLNQTLSRTILTSFTTVLVSIVLQLIGGEVIHSFALALTFGIFIGTYSSIFVASPIVWTWNNFMASRAPIKGTTGKPAMAVGKR
ncbi:MAG: protein translocase subunit SecF, partial [Candidatus Schekmanbacteria bacterium]|nr:protein translocase subunit SecF [Candidatus Schekmanbacteria bacterium]